MSASSLSSLGDKSIDEEITDTKHVQPYLCQSSTSSSEKRLFLVDTPGFDDTSRSDVDVLREIAAFLNRTYEKHILLAGIIYLHRISDNRFGGSAVRQMHMFRKLCGEKSMENIALVTTMWSMTNQGDGERRERELKTQDSFWKQMLASGAKAFRHDHGSKSALMILKYLIGKKRQPVFQIQKEMVDNHKRLDETAAGQTVEAELVRLRKKHEKDLREAKQEMEQALKEKNAELAQELHTIKTEIQQKIQDEKEASMRLQASQSDLLEQMKKEHAST